MSVNEDNGFYFMHFLTEDRFMESVRTTIVQYLHMDRTMTQPWGVRAFVFMGVSSFMDLGDERNKPNEAVFFKEILLIYSAQPRLQSPGRNCHLGIAWPDMHL